MKILAQITSYIFHPLLFPSYGTLLILLVNPHMFSYYGNRIQHTWLIVVFSLTFMFPAVWLLMMKKLEMIDNFKLETTKDRIIPFVATATFFLWATWMFKPAVHMKIPSNLLVYYMLMGACFSVFMAFIINIISKISLHTIAAGSLVGLVIRMIHYSTYDLRLLLLVAIVLAGLVGTARLVLKSHTQGEVMSGYLVGFTGQFLAFSIVPMFF